MATLNLGAIRYNWKGAYNGSTAYVVNDVVSANGNSYICIQAGTGQAVGNATAYWNIMSSAGTDGTDLTSTLTTQGDILYRDGSGLQRLPKGTAGQVLQMNSGATAPEYGTVSSDFVKIAETSPSGVTSVSFDNVFATGTYNSYKIVGANIQMDTSRWLQFKFRNSTPADVTNSYYWILDGIRGSSSSDVSSLYKGWDSSYIPVTYWSTVTTGNVNFEINVGNPASGTGFKHINVTSVNHNTDSEQVHMDCSGMRNQSDTYQGFKIAMNNSGNLTAGTITVYGLK